MNINNLQNIANVLRVDSLKMTTAAKSGHPSSCLSCAEIMSVLFFNEMKYDIKNSKNPDNDEFIMSKGHAAPILYSSLFRTGCIKDKLETLRQLNSNLEGHPVPRSLDWIKVATGSLGQGLGVGVGMAKAAKMQKRKFKTYVLMGDSESAEGSIYEALEIASFYKLNNLVAIIDINRLGQRGDTLLGHNILKYKKKFSGFGWNVITIDGHNIKEIISALKKTELSTKPTLILAKTIKGRGVSFIENKNGWHGRALKEKELSLALKEIKIKPLPQIKIKKPKKINYKYKKSKLKLQNYNFETSTRKVYGETLASLASSNENIIAIDSEVSNSTFSANVKIKTPKQFIENFIAEQNMVSMATGFSVKGFNVFASTFAAFFSRAYDQVRMAGISSANLTFCGSHAGVSIGEDGASQMALEDIGMFRAIPNSTVLYPCDSISAQKLTVMSKDIYGIKYIRTSRPNTPTIYKKNESFKIGEFKILKQSKKDYAVLIGSGITTHEALKSYEELKKQNRNVAVIDIYSIKPFNHKKLIKFVNQHGNKIVIAEDHHAEGGIGEMISSKLSPSKIKIKHLFVSGIPHSGTKDELLNKYKINSRAYSIAVNKF